MDIINLNSNSVSLSSRYVGDEDIELLKKLNTTEDGLKFFHEKFLESSNDRRINNYSSLYLTNKKKLTDIVDLERLDYDTQTIFTTSISKDTYFLTISTLSATTQNLFVSVSGDRFIDSNDLHFEIDTLSSSSVSAKIIHRYNGNPFYLTYNNTFYFSDTFDSTKAVFKFALDKTNNKMALFYKTSAFCLSTVWSGDSDATKLSSVALTLTGNNHFQNHFFDVNYYIQELTPRLNTSWVSYDKLQRNTYKIDSSRSKNDLKNNFLVTTQYSHVTSDTLDVNLITLKNQKTNTGYSIRGDFTEKRNDIIPNVDFRDYKGLFTGNDQEKGDHNISLSYEFYNSDYKFDSDKYTVFVTPESLYPYEKININDLNWDKIGSIAGESPYTSDRIYRKKVQNGSDTGEYVCTWLKRKADGTTIWLDRYYNPEKTSYATALSTTYSEQYNDPIAKLLRTSLSASEYYDVPFVYNSFAEEYANTPQTPKSALYGIAFFDKRSDLVIEPNSEYIYYRIGSDYVKIVLDTLNEFLIQSGMTWLNSNDAEIKVTDGNYVLDGGSYSKFQSYSAINIEHQFTLGFWLKSDDWSAKFGHQILGNLNEKGFALLSDRKVTPMITIQDGKDVYVYNTDFIQLDDASLDNENIQQQSKIRDIYRTDHLDSFYTITID